MDEVRIEVMRARGAGGQVRPHDSLPRHANIEGGMDTTARQQNRICGSFDPHPDWDHGVYAG